VHLLSNLRDQWSDDEDAFTLSVGVAGSQRMKKRILQPIWPEDPPSCSPLWPSPNSLHTGTCSLTQRLSNFAEIATAFLILLQQN